MPEKSTSVSFGATIFLSAFLLFSLEPLVAKRILPWFGGSAAVWSTCLVFYQTALLLGYLYARLLTRLRPTVQAIVHALVLLVSLGLLPIGPGERWKPGALDHPAWQILFTLAATIGLPFFALSATSPLLQHWLSRGGFPTPYRFFALSNFASLAALLAYPVLLEPWVTGREQRIWWSAGYAAFVIGCAWCGYQSRGGIETDAAQGSASPLRKLQWFALSACGALLLLAVTNHISENVAPVPLLWVLPLAVYLVTFILTFGSSSIYKRRSWLRPLAFALASLGYVVYDIRFTLPLQLSLPIFLLGLFVCCMFCHGELNRLRPAADDLTGFYLLVAFGGATGAIFAGLVAPNIFSGVYEFPLTLVLTALLALLLTWRETGWSFRLLWVAVTGCMCAVVGMNVAAYHENVISLRRSFYGALRVVQSPHAGEEQNRALFHGTIEHGAQYLWPGSRSRSTTYYGPDSGIGIVLRECFSGPKRVGMVGLGAGTTAAYGKPGDVFRFYEINRQVIEMANSLFFYLRESHAAIEIAEGDARLTLQSETAPPMDVLALDAFSGDAIPVHLLTREAMEIYRRRVKPAGVIAFHISNQYLDLAPVVKQLSERAGYLAVLVRSHGDPDKMIFPTDWVLVTNNRDVLDNPAVKLRSEPIQDRPGLRPWSDDYNSLLPIMKASILKK